MNKLFNIMLATALAATVVSCGKDDDFTESIFDTTTPVVDQNLATAPFDQWLYDNFVVPYNTEIQYKFNFPASNMNFQLTPADYEKSQLLSYFIKYLFYDVYTLYGGENFMKLYGPRIFHFIGSSAYSPTTGTETLGYASAGVKITLIKVNNMKVWREDNEYTPTDVDLLNKDQFHTMHHEFSHILHQTKTYPVSFGQLTPGTYDGRDWQKRDSVDSHRFGYVTQYGSSAIYEDFVETLSCTITDTDYRWMTTIIDAWANSEVKDEARVMELIDSLGIEGLDTPGKIWNNFTLYLETAKNNETGDETYRYVPSFHQADARQHATEDDDRTLKYTEVKKFTSFRDFLKWTPGDDNKVTMDEGINAILKKLDIATKWYTEKWGLQLFQIRREVRKRQNAINDFVRNEVTIYQL
ncbi:MAG: hypothetical protein K5896_00240 [Prevotella sp.]|nr:hypothetical protein [Prevotella sp.]